MAGKKFIDFDLMPERGDFVKNMSAMVPNDHRFAMALQFDKSTYLTKVRRIQGRDFDSYCNRNIDCSIR